MNNEKFLLVLFRSFTLGHTDLPEAEKQLKLFCEIIRRREIYILGLGLFVGIFIVCLLRIIF